MKNIIPMEQVKKVLTVRGLLITVCIIALLLFLERCGFINLPFSGKKINTVYVTPKEIIKIEKADEVINKKANDSFNLAIQKEQAEKSKWKLKYEDLMTDYLNAENDFNNELAQKVPDTCLPYQQKLITYYNGIITKNANKDKAAGNTIASLERLNKTKDDFLKEKNRQLAKQKSLLDTCIQSAKTLEKLKPKNAILLGANMMGNQSNFFYGYGINLGLQNKKGTIFEIGVMQISSTTQFTVGVKTRLFKF